MIELTYEMAERLLAEARSHARANGARPMAIAVVDEAGILKAFGREDGTSLVRADLCIAKAVSALAFGRGTTRLEDLAGSRPNFVLALNALTQGGAIPAAGGVAFRQDGDHPIGAIGISGDSSEVDEACAIAAVSSFPELAVAS
jgi:uncharacterized protein GlcG (DUF336 family)